MMQELSYHNNPQSLFRKYARLVTWFANTPLGKAYLDLPDAPIGLLLPNGYHIVLDKNKKLIKAEALFYTRPLYASKLYPALRMLDLVLHYVRDFEEAKQILLWGIGASVNIPDVVKAFHFNTLTVNPNAHPETTSVDGYVYRAGGASYAACRSGAGTTASYTTANAGGVAIRHFNNAGSFEMARSLTLFDTSSLTSAATLVSAIASVYGNGKNIDLGKDFNVDLLVGVPASNTQLVAADFNIANWTMSLQSDTEINTASWNATGYNDFPLNATGLSNVSVTGITKFGWSTANDRTNTDPSLAANQDERVDILYAENGTNMPKLVITYTLPGGIIGTEI